MRYDCSNNKVQNNLSLLYNKNPEAKQSASGQEEKGKTIQEIELYKQMEVIDNKIISTQDEIITLQKEYINFLEGLLKE